MVLNKFGDVDGFVEQEIPLPDARPGHVVVRVLASSVNPVDYKIRSGALEVIAPEAPTVLGCDFAGEIEEVGEGVVDFQVGDQVFGCAGGVKGCPGALCESMEVDAALIAPKPEKLTMEESAALPLVTITAWDGLIDRANVRKGQRVLVHGGTGGVGHVGIQLAKLAGAEVYVTASSDEKLAAAKDLGADVGIDYTKQEVAEYVAEHTGGDGFDVVFDTVGGDNVLRSFEAAALNGTVVSVNTRVSCDLSLLHQKSLSLHVVFMLIPMLHSRGRAHHGEILRSVAQHADAGRIRPLVHPEKFRFSEVGEAHALLESGKAVGKVVLLGF